MSKDKIPAKYTTGDFVRFFNVHLDMGDENDEPVPSSKLHLIEDADNLKDFLKNAKTLWILRHHSTRRRGRPSERGRVFGVLWAEDAKGLIGKNVTQGKLIQIVREQLGDEPLSEDAIRKYVKMWRILRKHNKVVPDLSLPVSDRQWFEKHASKTMKAFTDYHAQVKDLQPRKQIPELQSKDALHLRYPSPLRGRIGNQPEIAMIIDPPIFSRPDLHDKLHLLERELMDFLPPVSSR